MEKTNYVGPGCGSLLGAIDTKCQMLTRWLPCVSTKQYLVMFILCLSQQANDAVHHPLGGQRKARVYIQPDAALLLVCHVRDQILVEVRGHSRQRLDHIIMLYAT